MARIYKQFVSGTTGSEGVVFVAPVVSGRIVSIQYSIEIDSVTDNSAVRAEWSFVPASQIAVNDSQGDIAEVNAMRNATEGDSISACGQIMLDVPIQTGQRLYLNTGVAGTITYSVTAYVHVA